MTGHQSRSEFLALMAAASATVAIAIDAMLPAFSEVREHFDLPSTSSEVALIITVFMAGLGIGQIFYGPLADRFGRKPVFVAGLLLYVVAGFATTLAPSLETLLVGRFLWGLGAAGPRVVAQAMLRDRFRGDELARAMAVILAIFLVVPALAPAIGEAVLRLGSWRYTFAVGPVFGALVAVWSTRVSESLDVAHRRPIDLRSVGRAVIEVFRTPSALGNTIALTMLIAAFLPYLGSSERIYEEVYGRGSQFFLWFGATAAVMAVFTLGSSRLVRAIGSERATKLTLAVVAVVALVYLTGTIASDGTPSFAFFYIGTTLLVSLHTALTPLLTSRALHDVGHIAGTAASTIGAISFVGGSLLSPIVDSAISTTVTPFAVGYFVFSVVAAVGAIAADRFSDTPAPVEAA
ncbi:MAG: multidrug effflux MFS transporter [Acidimicrobiia bacterium]|nr:multidrug effflux MFS transporter [Acidimicrobiia bacterium]